MNRFLLKIFTVVFLLICISLGCSDINTVTSSDSISIIKSVVPAHAPYGADVKISGSGFGDGLEDQQVYFNNTLASIDVFSDTLIHTRVPIDATNGPVKVIMKGDTLTGPSFSVDTTKSLFLSIESIKPSSGRAGENVQISGVGFNSNPDKNAVFFDEAVAPVLSANDTLLTSTVPPKAQTGPVTVVTNQDTAVGPEFTVIQPMISGISPQSGPAGTDVTITGSGFSSEASENLVTFSGVTATVKTASESELVATVPEGAETGPVNVVVAGVSAEGPEFAIETLEEPKSLTVIIQTTGEQIDEDGYTLSVSGKGDRTVKPNDEQLFEDILAEELQVELSGIAENCSPDGENPRKVAMDSDKTTTFSISCINPNEPPIASFTSECTNLACAFDGSGSSDSDGSIASYSWEFGDGQMYTGQSIDYTYDNPGTYTVQLTVTDDDGATDSISNEVTLTVPQITSISPTSGPVSTDVTISGSGFSSTIAENVVTFNGVQASIETASETEIHALVPEMATTGPVEVTVNGYTVSGPTFTVEQPRTLRVTVTTVGSAQDDGYTLSVTGQTDTDIQPNDEIEYSGLFVDDVQVSLSDVASNCRVTEENPRNISLTAGMTTDAEFNVDCTMDVRGLIAFQTTMSGNSDIHLRDANSTLSQPITTTNDVYETGAAISPNGLKIAFAAYTGSGNHIFVMDSDGSNVQQLTTSDYNSEPAWSPDGSQIVFEKDPGTEIADLYIIEVDGSNLTEVTPTTDSFSAERPDWSPDGNLIVYQSDEDGDQEIFIILPDGTNKQQLTNNTTADTEPEWSPDGTQIAFSRVLTDKKVHIMSADGTGVTELTPSSGSESSPTWSPDGTRMAYSKFSDGVWNINIYSIEFNDILSSNPTPSMDTEPHWNY